MLLFGTRHILFSLVARLVRTSSSGNNLIGNSHFDVQACRCAYQIFRPSCLAKTYVVGDRAVESRAFDGVRGRDAHLEIAVMPVTGVVSEPGGTGDSQHGCMPLRIAKVLRTRRCFLGPGAECFCTGAEPRCGRRHQKLNASGRVFFDVFVKSQCPGDSPSLLNARQGCVDRLLHFRVLQVADVSHRRRQI